MPAALTVSDVAGIFVKYFLQFFLHIFCYVPHNM